MPLLWRYLLRNYLQVFSLCVSGFIGVLFVTRFQNVARFAATGASKLYILKFILCQIPFILPIAILVSCLIAALILLKKMSETHELTTLRASGVGLFSFSFPLLICGTLISILNFTIVSELSPKCRGLSKGLAYQMATLNPLCLLQKETPIKLKNTYVGMKVLRSGKYAEDVCLIMPNFSNQRLGLMLAKKLSLEGQKIIGNDVTFISSIDPKNEDYFDHLVIENQGQMETGAEQIAQYLRNSDLSLGYDSLNFRMLWAKRHIEKETPRAFQEIARRISLGLAPFIFTLVGLSFGMEIGSNSNHKKILRAVGLLVFYLIVFVGAKSMKHNFMYGAFLYLIPHPVILFFCLRRMKILAKGIA